MLLTRIEILTGHAFEIPDTASFLPKVGGGDGFLTILGNPSFSVGFGSPWFVVGCFIGLGDSIILPLR